MDDLEARFKGLRLRAPSDGLDRRIQAAAGRASPGRRTLPLWVAAAASFAMAFAGFAAGAWWRDGRTGREAPITAYVMCDAPAGRNPFDFTRASESVPDAAPPVSIRTNTGG